MLLEDVKLTFIYEWSEVAKNKNLSLLSIEMR